MKLRAKLLTAGLVLLSAMLVVAFVLVRVAGGLIEDQAFDSLRAVREAKAAQIEAEVEQFIANLDVLANAESTIEALPLFTKAFHELGEPVDQSELNVYYESEFLTRARSSQLNDITVRSLQPDELFGKKLQQLYMVNDTYPVGEKNRLNDAGDGSEYSELHARFHPSYRVAQQNFGAYDIFLINDEDGDIVYSVFKEIDVGTSLATGAQSTSGLGDAWRKSLETSDAAFSDFAPYLPSYEQPAAFAAQGVFNERGVRIGTIAMQAPIDRINAVMTSGQMWADVGLGESGETYIVASDLTMRNDSRFLIEDPDGYFEAIQKAGVPGSTYRAIEQFNTTVGLQPVDTEGTRDALAGNTDERIFDDYRDISVLSSYRPLDIGLPGVRWVIMSEIDKAEAFEAERTLLTISAWALAGIAAAALIALAYGASRLIRPLRILEDETLQVEAYDFTQVREYRTGRLDKVGDRKDEIGDLAGAFSRMVTTLGFNVRSRTEAEAELNVAAEIQQSMLPLIFPTFPDSTEFTMHSRLVPAKEIGGDFYEHGFIDDDHFFFTVGDVSGKGVPAALFMAATKTLVRSGAISGEPLDEMMTRINHELSRENAEMMFSTVWIGVLDVVTGEVLYVNAGHNPPALVTKSGVSWIEDIHGPMVGPIEGVTYTSGSLMLDVGDMIVVFSDGVTEAFSPTNELYSEQRLADLLTGDTRRADRITETVIDSVLAWEDSGERSDDVTVCALRWTGPVVDAEFKLVLPFDRLPEGESLHESLAEDVSKMNDDLSTFAETKGVSDAARMKMAVALDEVLVNSASYSGATAVAVRAWASPEKFTVEISDDGIPFNPWTVAAPDTDAPLQEREVGGLGWHLVRSLIPSVEYEYTRACNVLTLTIEGES